MATGRISSGSVALTLSPFRLLLVLLLATRLEALRFTNRELLQNDNSQGNNNNQGQNCNGQVQTPDVKGLKFNFYACTCPQAQQIVADKVAFYAGQNQPGKVTAALLRLLFHDCFVRGCDGSVLIDPTPGNPGEKSAIPNFALNPLGFDVVDGIKAALEAACPRTVSCADIVALGGREAVIQAGGPSFDMPLGRLDGTISSADEANTNIPAPNWNVTLLTDNFAKKGLSQKDMVVLSGAHTLGVSHCASFFNRLNPTDSTYPDDFKQLVNAVCNSGAVQNCLASGNFANCLTAGIVSLVTTDQTPGSHFSNDYYQRLTTGYGVFTSDVTLFRETRTRGLVQQFANDQQGFFNAFTASLLNMARVDVQAAPKGNPRARANCRVVGS